MGDFIGSLNRRMNRALRQARRKRCSYRMRGAGYGMGAPLVDFNPKVDTDFSIKMPVNQGFSDCAFPARQGQLFNAANPALAQTAMVGGRRGCGCTMRGGRRRRNSRKSRKSHTRKSQRGGRYFVDPWYSVGGDGPNVGALVGPVPCDARGGSPNPYNQQALPDVRAPMGYSATSNIPVQKGGAYSTSNNWSAECNKAPGSQLPVYNATTAGFRFEPSSAVGGTLPDGVTAYNNVVAQAARVGGARRRTQRKRR